MKAIRFTVAVCLFLAATVQADVPQMNTRVAESGGFDVIGIKTRTTNRAEMTADGKIPKLWEQIYTSNVIERIPNKTTKGETVVVYYEYESDKDGEYSYLIGARVTSISDVPEGMSAVHVPEGKYAIFTSDPGPAAQVVPAAWKRIWSVKQGEPGANRAYKVDYEVYDEHDKPEKSQVEIYVGVK